MLTVLVALTSFVLFSGIFFIRAEQNTPAGGADDGVAAGRLPSRPQVPQSGKYWGWILLDSRLDS